MSSRGTLKIPASDLGSWLRSVGLELRIRLSECPRRCTSRRRGRSSRGRRRSWRMHGRSSSHSPRLHSSRYSTEAPRSAGRGRDSRRAQPSPRALAASRISGDILLVLLPPLLDNLRCLSEVSCPAGTSEGPVVLFLRLQVKAVDFRFRL